MYKRQIFSLVINVIIEAVGEESIARIFNDVPVLGEAAAALVGLIPVSYTHLGCK